MRGKTTPDVVTDLRAVEVDQRLATVNVEVVHDQVDDLRLGVGNGQTRPHSGELESRAIRGGETDLLPFLDEINKETCRAVLIGRSRKFAEIQRGGSDVQSTRSGLRGRGCIRGLAPCAARTRVTFSCRPLDIQVKSRHIISFRCT